MSLTYVVDVVNLFSTGQDVDCLENVDLACVWNLITYRGVHPIPVVHTPRPVGSYEGVACAAPRLFNSFIQGTNIMTTQNVATTNAQFKRDLKAGRTALDKSHKPVTWAILHAIETQDLSQLDSMRASVAEAWPVLRSRFDDYVLATLDTVTLVNGVYFAGDKDGEVLFALSQCAVLATPWNTRDKLAKGAGDIKPIDPRTDVKRLINKCGKRSLVESLASKKNAQHVADILARAMADIEAVAAGTYKKTAKPVKRATTGNVVGIKAA